MTLSPSEQILHALKRSEKPVIILKELANIDDFASAFGLVKILKKLAKETEIICLSGKAPESLTFLKNQALVKGDLLNLRTLTVHVNLAKANVDELSYTVNNDELRINVTPKNGFWQREDVRVSTTAFRYDLIITLGAQDLKSLGILQEKYADFFYETPIINIDHLGSNDFFGQYQAIDVSAVSVSEVLFELFNKLDSELIDEEIATSFLTGMIAKTKSFKTSQVTPKTLATVSALIEKGGQRELIVENLYRTRSVETLRLWGRALSRLKSEPQKGLVWTTLTRNDFIAASAKEEALSDIVSELLSTSPSAKLVAIIYEQTENNIAVKLFAERPLDALSLGAPFKAFGTREQARLSLPDRDLVEAEHTVITHLKNSLA